ncbi:MAG: hypothetical protein HYV29_03590 [Ignavibacteriales bacterium]|nr:hypothetical protein [Ignavibacteriales bacterium]
MVVRIFIALLIVSLSASAQLFNGRLTTSLYGFQGRDTALAKQTYLRAYENIYLTAGSGDVSFNMNAMVSNDFGSTLATDPELRVSSLLVKVRKIGGLADLSVGRQFIYAGAGYGLIDGMTVNLRMWENTLYITGYGGTNVIHSRDIRSQWIGDNGMFGGQLVIAPVENGSIGVSYANKRKIRKPYEAVRADSLFNPQIVVINSLPLAEELASLDAEYDFAERVFVQAKTEYDFDKEDVSKIQAFTRVRATDQFSATVEYIFREPRVAYNSIFSVFNVNSTKEIEGGVEFRPMAKTFLFARFANVEYIDENSQRLAVGGTYDFISASYTQNFGYAGELNGISLQAVYPMMERMLTPMLGVGYASYKHAKEDPSNTVLNLNVGAVYRPMQSLSTDLQLQWMQNPQFDSDMRLFVKFTYWFNERMNWF